MDLLSLRVRPPENTEDVEARSRDPEILLEEVQSLHERIDKMSSDKPRQKAAALRKEHRELKRESNRLREEFDHPQPSGTVDAYLEEIQIILIEAGIEGQEGP